MTELLVKAEEICAQKVAAHEDRAIEHNNDSSALTKLPQDKLKRSKSREGNLFIKDERVYEDPLLVAKLFSEHLTN